MKSGVCPECGQRMLEHYGERFTIQQSDILSHIKDVTEGRGGISMDSLAIVFFPNQHKRLASQRIRSVVTHINNKLASTNFRIVGPGCGNKDGVYKFIKSGRAP